MLYTINTLDQLKPILIGFRKYQKLSQKDMAIKIGISQQSYQALESKPQKATIERLYKVLALLGVKFQLVDTVLRNGTQTTKPKDSNQKEIW